MFKKVLLLMAVLACGGCGMFTVQPPQAVPGASIANASRPLLARMFRAWQPRVSYEFACWSPRIYEVRLLQQAPWTVDDGAVTLQGTLLERWRVNACGRCVEVYILLRPSTLMEEGYVIGASYRPSVAFEVQPQASQGCEIPQRWNQDMLP